VDITVTHEVTTAWKTLEAAARAAAPPELMTVEAKGRYRGPGVPDGFVKTNLTLRFGSPQRSLARDDVNAWRDAAARRLHALPGAKVDGVKEEA
jgi:phenylalanyl-tRNA synthetase beta subunit